MTLDVYGVGCSLLIPLSTYYSLPNQHEVRHAEHPTPTCVKMPFSCLVFLTGRRRKRFSPDQHLRYRTQIRVERPVHAFRSRDLFTAIQAGDTETLGTVSGIGKSRRQNSFWNSRIRWHDSIHRWASRSE